MDQATTKEQYIRVHDEYIAHAEWYKDFDLHLLYSSGDNYKDTLRWLDAMINPKHSTIIYD